MKLPPWDWMKRAWELALRVRDRPTKAERELRDIRAKEEIRRIEEERHTRVKNAAFERAWDRGREMYREEASRQGRRPRLTDQLEEERFAVAYAEKHWREFYDPE